MPSAPRPPGCCPTTLLDLGYAVIAFDIVTGDGTTRVMVNLGQQECPIPRKAEVLIASQPGITDSCCGIGLGC
jgi:hypothetical protein